MWERSLLCSGQLKIMLRSRFPALLKSWCLFLWSGLICLEEFSQWSIFASNSEQERFWLWSRAWEDKYWNNLKHAGKDITTWPRTESQLAAINIVHGSATKYLVVASWSHLERNWKRTEYPALYFHHSAIYSLKKNHNGVTIIKYIYIFLTPTLHV